ncbi:teicoplanin resistance protein VanZ [Bifidobacterium choerinum]|uniref:Teicoplanin resistance protein VanZ n=1 Tax=Bifidobacterium choerinum TaxID=35760 RepID=A0A087AGS9_9BIFI|nr:teicoplanin resistance protein VanZ [Bifidobacterium choerinum]
MDLHAPDAVGSGARRPDGVFCAVSASAARP